MSKRLLGALIAGALIASANVVGGGTAGAETAAAPEVRLEVKFAETLLVRGEDENLRSGRGETLSRVRAVLDRARAREITPLVQGVPAAKLADLAVDAQSRSGKRVPDMAAWYTVTLPADANVDEVTAQLRALPQVVYAYPAPDPVPPPESTTPDFTDMQGYLRPAPQGIDADFSRQEPRARGAGIKIVDLEYDWNPFHEDLQLDWTTDLGGDVYPRNTFFMDEHGTAVFGELVARDNDYGVTGGVPEAEMYGISPTFRLPSGRLSWRPGPALVYLAGLGVLEPGDAVLLEQQTVGPRGDDNYAPLEWIPSVFEAIQLLTGLGVTVVETGGNGNQNVDDDVYVRDGIKWFDRSVQDSGAILVGAGSSTEHERLGFSNYGARFDLQGWGHNIVTTGSDGDLWGGTDPANLNIRYTRSFGGTSGAGPIVTAAVVAIQSYLKATGQKPWSATQIADLLKATGTPQGPRTRSEHIGPLPDLAAALTAIEVDPPTTTATLHPRPPRGNRYVDPLVRLKASDGWGSGVARTEYRLDGGPWRTYERPFHVRTAGSHLLHYRSIDDNGNLEKTQTLTFRNRAPSSTSG